MTPTRPPISPRTPVPPPKNVIPTRIADALRKFPPFSMLAEADILALAANATVRVMVNGDHLWQQGDRPSNELLFLARGRVEYHWQHDERSELVDVRDVGDSLGLAALYENHPYRVTAHVLEDSLFYGLDWTQLRPFLDANDTARNYIRRHLFWATRVGGEATIAKPEEATLAGRAKSILQAHLDGAQMIRARPGQTLLSCPPETPIHLAAQQMAARRVPSILVTDPEQRPLGILTNHNLVHHVIVAGLSKDQPVSSIMSAPVHTVSDGSSATAALLVMLRERIGQLCVTEDGTPNTRALDVCSEKDLLTQSGNHPAGLMREFRRASSPARLRELCDDVESIIRGYLEAGVSAIFAGQICAELYDELTHRLVELAHYELSVKGINLPTTPWAWISVGSDGRREQILRTDMDNALIFTPTGDPTTDESHRGIFLKLAARVVELLVECGFSRCQGGVMASNPNWCKTQAEWLHELETLDPFAEPDRMLRAMILYDLRFVVGDKAICDPVRQAVFVTVARNHRLQQTLAQLVVQTPPPLNFWGKFIVEKKGGREGLFDIKTRALSPLRDAARLLALKHGLTRRYSTGGRWEDLRRQIPKYAELAELAREAYDHLLRLRTLNGLRQGDAGRFLAPDSLSKLDRAQLANHFDVLRMVQTAVRAEFQLDALR